MIAYTKACEKTEFEAKLCCCFQDCSVCCFTLFCYPCANARAWSASRGEKCSCLHICGWEIYTRSNIRHARNMPQRLCGDCCTHLFCPLLTVAQDLREIKFIVKESKIKDSSDDIPPPITNPSNQNINNNGPSSPASPRTQDIDETENQFYYNYPNPPYDPNNQFYQPAFIYPQQFAYNPYVMPQPMQGAPVFAVPYQPTQFQPQLQPQIQDQVPPQIQTQAQMQQPSQTQTQMQQPNRPQPPQASAKTHHRPRHRVAKKDNHPKENPPKDNPTKDNPTKETPPNNNSEEESSDEPATQSTSKTATNPRAKSSGKK